MGLTFSSTSERRQGYRNGTTVSGSQVSAPTAPTISLGQSTASTQPVTITGGSGATTWNAVYKAASDSGWTTFGAVTVGAGSSTTTGLSADTSYSHKIVASNSAGSADGNTATGYTLPAATVVSASRQSDTVIRFTFTGGSAGTGWTGYYRTPSGSGSYTSVSLTQNQAYYDLTVSSQSNADFYVITTNSAGTATSNTATGSAATGTNFAQILYYEDFTGGTNGAGIGTVSSWGSAPGVIADDPLGAHGKSAKDVMVSGSKGFIAGGIYTLPFNLTEGDEAWFRIKLYMPVGFSYSANPHLKFFRWRTRTSGGSHLGYDDWYIEPDGDHKFIYEGEQSWHYLTTDQSFAPIIGEWVDWEQHIVFGSSPVSSGGVAKSRMWRNGVLIGEVNDRRTLNSSTDQAFALYFQTYWNGGVPQNETWYWTKAAVAVKSAGNRDDSGYLSADSGGRPFIGTS